MKKTISFNLEEDIIAKIENYQKKNNLSSRSAALERIILAMGNNNIDSNLIVKLLNDIKTSINNKKFVKKENANDELGKSISNCFNEMPD